MRDVSDLKHVSLAVRATVEIDLERVEDDPTWPTVARNFDLTDPEQKKQALEQYICRYLGNENLLELAPFTNGPAAIIGFEAEVQ